MPVTKKTAVQSELIKQAQPELAKLEKKYQGKDSQEDQTKKAQEMMLIYQKLKALENINPAPYAEIVLLSILLSPMFVAH